MFSAPSFRQAERAILSVADQVGKRPRKSWLSPCLRSAFLETCNGDLQTSPQAAEDSDMNATEDER
jgi:hypothetical protein